MEQNTTVNTAAYTGPDTPLTTKVAAMDVIINVNSGTSSGDKSTEPEAPAAMHCVVDMMGSDSGRNESVPLGSDTPDVANMTGSSSGRNESVTPVDESHTPDVVDLVKSVPIGNGSQISSEVADSNETLPGNRIVSDSSSPKAVRDENFHPVDGSFITPGGLKDPLSGNDMIGTGCSSKAVVSPPGGLDRTLPGHDRLVTGTCSFKVAVPPGVLEGTRPGNDRMTCSCSSSQTTGAAPHTPLASPVDQTANEYAYPQVLQALSSLEKQMSDLYKEGIEHERRAEEVLRMLNDSTNTLLVFTGGVAFLQSSLPCGWAILISILLMCFFVVNLRRATQSARRKILLTATQVRGLNRRQAKLKVELKDFKINKITNNNQLDFPLDALDSKQTLVTRVDDQVDTNDYFDFEGRHLSEVDTYIKNGIFHVFFVICLTFIVFCRSDVSTKLDQFMAWVRELVHKEKVENVTLGLLQNM